MEEVVKQNITSRSWYTMELTRLHRNKATRHITLYPSDILPRLENNAPLVDADGT